MWHDFFEYFSFRPQFNEDCPNARYIPKRSQSIKCDKTKCSFCEITRYKNSQADFVEVVRCEICKYCKTHTCAITGKETLFCDYGNTPVAVEPEHFCSYGERQGQNGINGNTDGV